MIYVLEFYLPQLSFMLQGKKGEGHRERCKAFIVKCPVQIIYRNACIYREFHKGIGTSFS